MADKEELFDQFAAREHLSEEQLSLFKVYFAELMAWNEKINITAITSLKNILRYHFEDSLMLKNHIDLTSFQAFADVGAGGGFPGIPLKICFPDLPLYLIEVNKKRISFLEHIIDTLSLPEMYIIDLDWRTFLRKTDFAIDLFVTRASLAPLELMRMFKPASPYKHAQLVYWASADWQPEKKVLPYLQRAIDYRLDDRRRKLIFFSTPQTE